MKIIKRDGSLEEFNKEKILIAIDKAVIQSGSDYKDSIASEVTEYIISSGLIYDGISVEEIQDIVEKSLIHFDLYEISKSYILYRNDHSKLRELMPNNKLIEDYVFTSKYAKYLKNEKRRETFEESVKRSRDMHLRKYPQISEDINFAFECVLSKRCLPSMRSMQFGGVGIEKINERIYNCSYSICDRVKFFAETMYLLLCGCGVGFSVEKFHVNKLPPIKSPLDDAMVEFVVEDSIAGWADAVNVLIESYVNGSQFVEFSYGKIRNKGERLETSGGKAPGHIPLRRAIEKARVILDKASGRKLKPIEAYDITMHLADSVIAGGIRRSATICLFDHDDDEMMNAKTGNWFEENPQRGRSNNSAKLIRSKVTKDQFLKLFEKQKEWGEPGFYFAENEHYGSNPCVEIGLNPILPDTGESGFSFCNLTEINGSKIKSKEDFRTAVTAATIIGTCQAGYTDFPYLGRVSEEICRREALLGVSITGMMDSPEFTLDPELQREMAQLAVDVNKRVAKKIGINQAARVTCVKPAGTTSLILGTSSGIHPRHAKRYIRRVQSNKIDNVYKFFESKNPHACKESVWSTNKTDGVIEFCIQANDSAITRGDVSALDLLKHVKSTQENWVLPGTAIPESSPGLYHNVSNTITVKDEEWNDVADFIWENCDKFTGVSMLKFIGDKVYHQAPHEEIVTQADEVIWRDIISKTSNVDYTEMMEEDDNTDLQGEIACAGGKCEL